MKSSTVFNLIVTSSFILFFLNFSVTQETSNDGFQVNIPNNWEPISPDFILRYNSNKKKRSNIKYGFRIKNGNELPLILIGVNESGRLPYQQLSKSYEYDSSTNIMWITQEENLDSSGKMKSLTGVLPTEKGFIEIECLSKEDDFEMTYKSIFRDIINSTTISPEIKYQPRWDENAILEIFKSPKGLGIALGTIIIVIYLISNSRKKKITPEELEARRVERRNKNK